MLGGTTRSPLATALLLALAGVAACAGGGSGGDEAAPPASQGSGSESIASDRMATRLERLPAPEGADTAVEVRIGDLDRVADLVGVPRPASTDDGQVLSDWQHAVLGTRLPAEAGDAELRPSPAAVPSPQSAVPDLGEEDWTHGDGRRGWNLLDIGWFAEASPLADTSHLTAVLGGTFTAERLTSSLGEPDAGVWSRVPESAGERTVLSPGMWTHAGLVDGDLVVSDEPDAVRAASDRRGPTLADNTVLADMAATLDAHGAYSAVLRSQVGGFPFPQRPGTDPEAVARARDSGQLFLDPFTGVGVGLAADDGPVALLVYVHDDAQAAGRNAEALATTLEDGNRYDDLPWAEMFAVVDVEADGRVVVASLRLVDGRAGRIFDLVDEADPTLFTHR